MKKLFYLFTLMYFYSCSSSNYYGYVYDFDKECPLENVAVYDSINKKKVFTNKEGYFEMNNNEKDISALIFSKNSYTTKKISTISIQNGEQMRDYLKGDTIYIVSEKN